MSAPSLQAGDAQETLTLSDMRARSHPEVLSQGRSLAEPFLRLCLFFSFSDRRQRPRVVSVAGSEFDPVWRRGARVIVALAGAAPSP